ANLVRWPFSLDVGDKTPSLKDLDKPIEKLLAFLSAIRDSENKSPFRVVLDVHSTPGGRVKANGEGYQKVLDPEASGQGVNYRNLLRQQWVTIVTRIREAHLEGL